MVGAKRSLSYYFDVITLLFLTELISFPLHHLFISHIAGPLQAVTSDLIYLYIYLKPRGNSQLKLIDLLESRYTKITSLQNHIS